jgi:hypothetical protein
LQGRGVRFGQHRPEARGVWIGGHGVKLGIAIVAGAKRKPHADLAAVVGDLGPVVEVAGHRRIEDGVDGQFVRQGRAGVVPVIEPEGVEDNRVRVDQAS